MKNYNIISVGSCVRDIVFYTNDAEFIKNPKNDPTKQFLLGFEYGAKIKSDEVYYSFGGGAANTAINLVGLGLNVAIMAGIGRDGIGKEIKNRLKSQKVNTNLLHIDKKLPTGISFLVVDSKSNEHVALVSYGANNNLKIKPVEADWYYISSLSTKNWPNILDKITKTKSKIAWNPGATQLKAGYKKLKKYLKHIDVLLLNKDEAIELCISAGIKIENWNNKKIAETIWSWGPALVAVTNGKKGVNVYYAGKHYFDKPHHDKPKDTTGAGDCFGSTFVGSLIRSKGDIKKSIKLAIANASSLVFKPGAQQGLLRWNQLIKRLK